MTYLETQRARGLMGLSPGLGTPDYFEESDYSEYDACLVVTDSDGDGIPDIWEASYGLDTNDVGDASLDSDGDGMINSEEYIADTDPFDNTSSFYIDDIRYQTNNIALIFPASTGRLYRLETATNLNASTWTILESGLSPTGSTMSVDQGSPTNQGVYRVRVEVP